MVYKKHSRGVQVGKHEEYKVCEFCAQPYNVWRKLSTGRWMPHREKRFCTISCQNKWQTTNVRPRPDRFCEMCKMKITFPVGARLESIVRAKYCSHRCRRAGIQSKLAGKAHIDRKGIYTGDRYIRVLTEKGSDWQHRVIASKALGRPLKRFEVVHHINGNKQDNRNCNLLICTGEYHRFLHHRMGELYQREHFPVTIS